jgi:hypothetical protein
MAGGLGVARNLDFCGICGGEARPEDEEARLDA